MKKYALVILLMTGLLLVPACGKKGPPSLASPQKAALVDSPAVMFQPGVGVRLTWTVIGTTQNLAGFDLTRGDERFGETQCRSCSDFYQPLANLDLEQASIAGEQNKYQFVDATVEGGWRYYYQITPLYKNGAKGPAEQISVDVD